MANRAKLNFSQCCLWMRDLSRSWPPASAHRIFFEGCEYSSSYSSNHFDTNTCRLLRCAVIQGGLELSDMSNPGGQTDTHRHTDSWQPATSETGRLPENSSSHTRSSDMIRGGNGPLGQNASTIRDDLSSHPMSAGHTPSSSENTPNQTNNTRANHSSGGGVHDLLAGTSSGGGSSSDVPPPLPDQHNPAPSTWPSDLLQLPSVYWNDALPTATTMGPFGQNCFDMNSPSLNAHPMPPEFTFGGHLHPSNHNTSSSTIPGHPTAGAGFTLDRPLAQERQQPQPPHPPGTNPSTAIQPGLELDNTQPDDASQFLVTWMLGALGRQ